MADLTEQQAPLPFLEAVADVPEDPIPASVRRLFEETALDLIRRGWNRYSSDAILHRIRWHMRVERGDRAFKCNDHWTAPLARDFLANHPEHDGFFELRRAKNDD